jgi:uncharacterized protein YjbJ (UPF0337 family)
MAKINGRTDNTMAKLKGRTDNTMAKIKGKWSTENLKDWSTQAH